MAHVRGATLFARAANHKFCNNAKWHGASGTPPPTIYTNICNNGKGRGGEHWPPLQEFFGSLGADTESDPRPSKSLPLRGRCPEGAEGESLAIARNISDSRIVLSPTACGRSPLAEGAKG